MSELELANDLFARISERDRYHPQAYAFVLAALEYCQVRRPVRGHISGGEYAWACRDFAHEQYGLTARTVLGHWGVESTLDIGRIVYGLIDAGLLVGQDEDRIDDFADVYQFDDAFERQYPWSGVNRSGAVP